MTEKDKLAELHDFLKYDVEVSFLDGDVIDVAMDVISKHIERIKNLEKLLSTHEPHGRNYTNGQYVKLIERVQELEDFKRNAEQLYKYHHLSAKKSVAEKEELREQNKRYREALEFYADEGTYEVSETLPSTDEYQQPIEPVFKTVPIIYYDKGKEARRALEGTE